VCVKATLLTCSVFFDIFIFRLSVSCSGLAGKLNVLLTYLLGMFSRHTYLYPCWGWHEHLFLCYWNCPSKYDRKHFRSCACLLDLFIVWHAYFPVTPGMCRSCFDLLISWSVDCLACLLSCHLCHVQILPANFKKSWLVCLACLIGIFNFIPTEI